jgi:hypothetical protein
MPTNSRQRTKLPPKTTSIVLTEAGYRCAVPTCRGILALDMHHIWQVSDGGGDDASNLIALCPTCHALHHRGTITTEAIYAYKSMLVALNAAFDKEAIDLLLFLSRYPPDYIIVSGDGLVQFSRLIAAGFVSGLMKANNSWQIVTYAINITDKGRHFVNAWMSGERDTMAIALLDGDDASSTQTE